MADPLRIGAEVDVSQLGKLGEGAQQVAAATGSMSGQFVSATQAASSLAQKLIDSGLTAKEAEGALVNMGYGARQAAAAMAQFSATTAVAGAEVQATTTKVDAFTRQLANSAIRIAASEAGMGQLGFAFGRLGAMSATLAPILASTFAVFAVVAFVEIVTRAVAAYQKWIQLGEEAVHKTDDLSISLAQEGDQMDVVNAHIENQIAKLEHKPENFLKVALAENRVEADKLVKSLEDVIQEEVAILEAGPGAASEFFLGKGNMAAVGDQLKPLERQLQLAILTGQHEEAKNLVLEKQRILRKALADEQAQHAVLAVTPEGIGGMMGRQPDQDAINEYNSLLKATEAELANIARGARDAQDRINLANAQTAAEQQRFASAADRDANKHYEMVAREELEVMDRIQRRHKLEDEAQRALDRDIRKNEEEERKAAKDAEEAWQHAAEARIRGEEEAFRVSQHAAENRMRDIKTQESLAGAGINKGPITSILEVSSLKEQGAVAAAAMNQANAAAFEFKMQLAAVHDQMDATNTATEEGATAFNHLEKQAEQLQHAMDGARADSDKWATTLKGIEAHMRELEVTMKFSWQNIGVAMENAAQAGFSSFNSSFVRMLHGATSFVGVLQSLWGSMVDSFVTAILRMAEYYVMKYVVMIAITKVFGATAGEAAGADISMKELDRQAAIGAAAATAAIGAAMLGPAAALAAAATVEAGLQAITSFQHGGIVKANLHEGEAVLPEHLTTFLMTAAGAAGAGGAGGAGGPGGPGGAGGIGNVTNHINLAMHNYGGAMTPGDVTTAVKRALRRSSYSI